MDPEATTANASLYTWHYTHGVDEKRRVAVPAKWRNEENGNVFTLIVWQSSDGTCVRAYPPKQMAKLLGEIDARPADDPNRGRLRRMIGGGSEQVVLDKVGRICLPEEMARAAGIEDKAVLVGAMDRFEIWSVERYQKVSEADSVMAPEALKLLG